MRGVGRRSQAHTCLASPSPGGTLLGRAEAQQDAIRAGAALPLREEKAEGKLA